MSESTAPATRLARRFPEEVATGGSIDSIDDIVSEDFVEHNAVSGETRGRDAAKAEIRTLREAFPDLEATVEDVVAEGDLVAMRVTLRGTHDGPFMGIEPTGNSFEVQNMVFTRVEDGQIAERWVQPDAMGMLRQLGVLPDDPAQLAASTGD